jgi:Ca-activated chloride channel family protein
MFANRKILQNYNDRVGVIGFGGTATMYQPLDSQLEKVSASIDRLQITHSGTMIGSSLHLAHTELMKAGTKRGAIVLLSDGGDEYDSSNPIQAASSFKSIKVFTVGIGTAKGADVRLPIGIKRVKLNESILRRIAKVTGGEYLYAPDIEELRKIYLKFADY